MDTLSLWAVPRASAHPLRPSVLFYRFAFLPATVVFGSGLDLLRILHSTGIASFTDMELLFGDVGDYALPLWPWCEETWRPTGGTIYVRIVAQQGFTVDARSVLVGWLFCLASFVVAWEMLGAHLWYPLRA